MTRPPHFIRVQPVVGTWDLARSLLGRAGYSSPGTPPSQIQLLVDFGSLVGRPLSWNLVGCFLVSLCCVLS